MSRWRLRARVLWLAGALASVLGLGMVSNGIRVTETHSPLQPTTDVSVTSVTRLPQTPIEHVIVVMQENHTFDNYFGTFPGADGIPAGTCLPENAENQAASACVAPFHLSGDTVEAIDLAHNEASFQGQYNNGQMDGFVRTLDDNNQTGRVAMGYYDDRDLPFYWSIAGDNVLFDHFFSSVSGGSFLNHLFWIAGASGGNNNGLPRAAISDVTTIFDELEERGIPWKFYVQDYDPNLTYRTAGQYRGNRASQVVRVPLLAIDRFIDDPRLASHIVDLDQYFDDLQRGALPAVAYVVPSSTSEHPPGRVQSGQQFVVSLLDALMRSDAWSRAAFMWTYSTWGGWYDHVPPPQVDAYGYGFRVPAVLVSPYARRGHVEHAVLDFSSILRFVEDNWGLQPLGERDALAGSIAGALDFAAGPRAPRFFSPGRTTEPAPMRVNGIIYATYGGATALACFLVVWAAVSTRDRRRGARPVVRMPVRLPSFSRVHRAWLAASLLVAVTVPLGALFLMRTALTPTDSEYRAVAFDEAVPEDDESSFPVGASTVRLPSTGEVAHMLRASAAPAVLSLARRASADRDLRTILDQRFIRRPVDWPDDPQSTAWFDGPGYHLATRGSSGIVAVGAPHAGYLWDVSVQASLRKVGGPAGGGYGLVVRDQSASPRDGLDQGGRYYVAQISDVGEVSFWRREVDHWVDLLGWTPSAAVRQGTATNQLELSAIGSHLSFLVNGNLVASLEDVELSGGRVGVFVGGDTNEVVLDRFVVRAPTR
jgi:phospholipase C